MVVGSIVIGLGVSGRIALAIRKDHWRGGSNADRRTGSYVVWSHGKRSNVGVV